jgi:hypothetical protein
MILNKEDHIIVFDTFPQGVDERDLYYTLVNFIIPLINMNIFDN